MVSERSTVPVHSDTYAAATMSAEILKRVTGKAPNPSVTRWLAFLRARRLPLAHAARGVRVAPGWLLREPDDGAQYTDRESDCRGHEETRSG